jgi:cytochrome c
VGSGENLRACSIFFLILNLTFPALGAATPEEAKALVEKAIAFYKANSRERALAEFSNPKGLFVNGHLYIFAYNPEGTIIAHGGDPKLVGQNFIDVKDADGKYFSRITS